MASSSSSSSAAAASKRAAAEELNLVESKLEEVNRQLESLEEERTLLLARQASLMETLNAKATVDMDWAGSFEWDAEVERVKREVFGIEAPFRPMQVCECVCVWGGAGMKVGDWLAGCKGHRRNPSITQNHDHSARPSIAL